MNKHASKQEILEVLHTSIQNKKCLYSKTMAIQQYVTSLIEAVDSDEDAFEIYSRYFVAHGQIDFSTKAYAEIVAYNAYVDYFGEDFYQEFSPWLFNIERTDEEFQINKIMRGRPLNRLNPGNKTVMTPIPLDFGEFDYSLREVCNMRAQEFLDMASTHTLYLAWSGGIDSTLAYYTLVDNDVPFRIIMNDTSYDEFPTLAEQILDQGIAIMNPSTEQYDAILADPNNVVISGGSGDEVFAGVGECEWRDIDEVEHWDDLYTDHISSDIQEIITPYIQQLVGAEQEASMTVGEFRWALHFIFKYQQIQVSGMYVLGLNLLDHPGRHLGRFFYDTPEFNKWSIRNFKKLATEEWKDKRIAKLLIYEHNHDEDYLNSKKKVCSMNQTFYRSGVEDIIVPEVPHPTYSATVTGTGHSILGYERAYRISE